MGDTKLCLLLLLGTCAFAQQDVGNAEAQSPTCSLARRFKNFRRFVYQYEAETHNGINGATNIKNGPKVSCKVEIDVPQTCSFILRTTECSLRELLDVDAEGTPIFEPASGAQEFEAAMAKNTLKVMVEGQTNVMLFPEEDEPTNILNIKRGIVSALVVPVLEEDRNKEMATLHGVCKTDYTINDREDIATDVTVTRDLSNCDEFNSHKDYTSPLALISGMQYPLSKLIGSTQTCNYRFDNQKKHMTFGTCTEKHIFLPFSHQNEYGVSTLVQQTLTLVETNKINDRVFEHNEANLKSLSMEATEDKAPIQTKDAAIATLRELNTLSQTNQGHQRASTFQKLVSELHGLNSETLNPAALEMFEISKPLTWQALAQCGTPECSSAILQILRVFETDAMEPDAATYAIGLLSNPSRLLVKDILAMAQYKQSKPIMYALSNVVRKLYQAEGLTPEVTDVSELMASILGADCSGEKEATFLALRVIGNMGEAMEAADAGVKLTLLKCMRQPATTLSVQLAAIQAFRRMSVTDEVRSNLQRVSQYAKGAVQKRLAAYLILMRKPEASDLEVVKKILNQELSQPNQEQVRAFVVSHVYNIISSNDPETQKVGKKLVELLQDIEIVSHNEYTKMSRDYEMEVAQKNMQAKLHGNMIFDPTSQLPKEVMLETTLKAFGYNLDMLEVGMEGKGFDSTIEALFGKNGFFPDTVSKAIYWAGDRMPSKVNEVLEKLSAPFRNEKVKVPENLMREIVRNFNKLAKDLQSQESPEAMAYLRIMGNEIGFIKASELKGIAQNAGMYAEIMMRLIPREALMNLRQNTDNELFAHYIFMDNKFTLPTASGFPLKFSLSGTFAPGAQGGLRIAPNMQEVSFRPSAGVEFVTQMGVFIPEFVDSAIEMHTNIYHESALNAKITMEHSQVKLSIPAPQDTTQLFRVSNRMLTVTSRQASLIPPMGEIRTNAESCSPLFTGIKYCTTARYSVAGVSAAAPYFPLNGETKFAVDIQPTGEVTDYTATFAYELLSEGKEGQQKVDSLKMILKAEGAEPTEATATMKYNRNRNIFTTNVEIPDYDVEAGIRVGLNDNSAKGQSITLEITNKNIPQLSLIGRAKLQDMTDGMLQVQLTVPSIKTDAAITATMNNAEELTMEIKSEIKLPETSSIQSVIFKYGDDEVEVKLVSDMNSEIQNLIPYTEAVHTWLQQLVEDIMDQQVVKTDMKLRHIITKALEAGNIWMDRVTTDVPYAATLRSSIPELAVPSMPDKLFLKSESAFRYQFNKNRVTITIPLPLGGKSSDELRIPAFLTTPRLAVPQIGLELPSKDIQVPTFSIPYDYDLTLPLMGMVEVSAKVMSNYYNWDGIISIGNNTVEDPSYIAKFNVNADSPIELLSFTSEGTALITDIPEESLKALVNASMNHKLLETSFSIMETVSVSDQVRSSGNIKFQASGPLGLRVSTDITSQCSLSSDIIIGDANMDGSVNIGSLPTSVTYSQSFSVEPMKKEARSESMLRVDSPILEFVNKIKAEYTNEELLIESNTNIDNEPIKHTTKFSIGYKEAQFTILSDSLTKLEEKMLHSQVDFTATRAEASIRVENQAADSENRVSSLFSGSLKPSGIEINADASIDVLANRASHKATLTLNMDGLITSCTTTAQRTPMTFENNFNGGIDASGASMSITTKGAIQENTAELNVEGKMASSEVYLNSMYKGNLFDADTRNRVNLRMNEDGLTFSNELVASLYDMKTDNAHSLTLSLGSLALSSKTDNFLNDRNSYKHDIKVSTERLTASVTVNNDLKIMDVSLNNEAQFKAEPYKMDLTGSVQLAFSDEELKHAYEISFADMTVSAKSNINGKLLGSQMTLATDMEVAGLTMKFNNKANVNSPFLRLDSNFHTAAEPFTLNIDALVNANGDLNLYGKQSGELYSKFLLKAEPLAFSHSHECRASTTHQLEGAETSVETNMDNKLSSHITLQKQSIKLEMKSKINNHALDQKLNAYNNVKKIGIELIGVISTTLLNTASENHEYSISGSVNYDKNSDSHFIQIPFIEHLPAVIEQVKDTMMGLLDSSIEMIKDINSHYQISAHVQERVGELKQVIDTFDVNLFIQDLKNFINSMDSHLSNVMDRIPTEQIIEVLKSIEEAIKEWFKRNNIAGKINTIFIKFEEFLSNYEIEKVVENIMEEAVVIMKQYKVRENIQAIVSAIKSIDIQKMLNKAITPVKELVDHLYAFDFKQMIDDISSYFDRIVMKIKSFDYDTFTMELKEKVSEMSKIPCFGQLSGEFKINSPDYNLKTTANLKNTSTETESLELKVNLNSQATSTFDLLDYTLDASAQIALNPANSRIDLSENLKAVHTAFTFDHQGTLNLLQWSAEATSKTTAKATTEPYAAELVNNVLFATENVSGSIDTAYKHKVNMPLLNIFSELDMNQKTVVLLEDGTVRLTLNNEGRGKSASQDYSDEGTHKSDLEVSLNLHTIKVSFTGATDSNNLKMKQDLNADICIFSHIIIDAKAETDLPFIKESADMNVEAKIEEMKIQVTASHNAEFTGRVEGTLSNSLTALVTPYELMIDTKNQENTKVALPFKLSGKVDLQNDFAITLNSGVQQASWTGLARFNQYKYSHYFSMDNGETEIHIFAKMNGEANLDVLREPINIPEITVPFLAVKTPAVEGYSLWEDTFLRMIMTTTQQTLDLDAKLKYMKNPELFTIDINMEPIFDTINAISKRAGREVGAVLSMTYDQVKAEYDQQGIEIPKTLTIPAYKVPMMNIEVSSFTIPLPDPSLFTMPVLHVQSAVSKLTFPQITMPKLQKSIMIPVMGDLTYEFSLKTAMITLKADAKVINQGDIVMELVGSSSSEFEILSSEFEGTSTLNRENGMKLSSAMLVKHLMVEGKHDSTINLNSEAVDAAITNSAKVSLPFLITEFNQELLGNPLEGIVVSLSSPSVGLLGLQLQTKRPAQLKGRLYSRYPSEPENDVDILAVKISVVNSEKLSLQTTWNMEAPFELMFGLKERVPTIMSTINIKELLSDCIAKTQVEINRISESLEGSFEHIKEQGKVIYESAVENIAALDITDVTTKFSDSAVFILRECQKSIQILLNAAIKFLRETMFKIPGHEEELSGLEVYQKLSTFFADVTEEALLKVPEFIASHCESVLDHIRETEFSLPGYNSIVSGGDIMGDLMMTLEKIRDQLILIVKKLGDSQLDEGLDRLSEFVRVTVKKAEELLVSLTSQDLEKLSTWMSDVYTDAINSRTLEDITNQFEEGRRIVTEYIHVMTEKLQDLFADMTTEQLSADIQSWIDSMVKRLNAFHNKVIELLKDLSRNVEPYLKMSDRQMDIDIPLTFSAESS